MKNSESYLYYRKSLIIFFMIWFLLTLFTSLILVFGKENIGIFLITTGMVFVVLLPFMIVMLNGMVKSKKAESKPFEMGVIKELHSTFHFLPKSYLYAKVELEDSKEIVETHPMFPVHDLKKLQGKEIQIVRRGKKDAFVLMVIR